MDTTKINPITGTEHDGICEVCPNVLTKENVIEGDLGFYCSWECCDEAEDGGPYHHKLREDFHADG